MAEAAEKRKREDEGRGVKDPEALKRKQQKREDIERKAEQSGGGGEGGLRVSLVPLNTTFVFYIKITTCNNLSCTIYYKKQLLPLKQLL